MMFRRRLLRRVPRVLLPGGLPGRPDRDILLGVLDASGKTACRWISTQYQAGSTPN